MRKSFCSIVALILSIAAYALPMNIECTGAHEVDGTDTLFFFAGEIHVHSKIGAVDWYATATGSAVQTGSEDFYPDDGGYYIIKDGVEYSPFYVFRCQTSALDMTVEANCDNTVLRFAGDVNPYTYIRRNGTRGTYQRTCSVAYTALAWQDDQWTDSAAQKTVTLSEAVSLPAMYATTPIRLCYDADIREALGLEPVCITGELTEDKVTAVSMQLTSLAVARGKEGEKSNELNRPTRQDIITATTSDEYSGALEVAFYTNPTPAALYYRWTIYKASEVIATRNDKDIRYSFAEPGRYRVVCAVSNQTCATDSMSMLVNISESYLAVPNFFTPGGSCGNAEFRVAYRSLREFHGWVFNRWGKLVFEWTDPAKGWDGTINGRLAADGAYFYVIRALGTDAPKNAGYIGLKASYQSKKKNGDESVTGVYQLSGDINLIRCRK